MKVLGVIIAGGKSSRMGQDKALMVWRGKALIAHVAERLAPQVDALVVNANGEESTLLPSGEGGAQRRMRALSEIQSTTLEARKDPHPPFGHLPPTGEGQGNVVVIPDLRSIGTPLAGLHAALTYAGENGFDAVLTAPCDAPLLPPDLRARLEGAGAAIAASAGQAHYLTGFWPVGLLGLFEDGQLRRVMDFAGAAKARVVEWEVGAHDPFANINTPEDFAALS
jgi:molybdopterin-guanine dinucleotide biosynthesis protein A